MSAIELQEIFNQAQRHDEHIFLMPTKLVAAGYGVGESTIRRHKADKPGELLENQHWIKDESGSTLWTARGVVQLGFCTQSKQGNEFRAWAESQIMGALQPRESRSQVAQLDQTAQAIAAIIVGQLSAEQILQERINHHVAAALDAQIGGVEAAALGKSLALQWGLQNLASLTEAIASQLRPGEVRG
ncbi:MAG: hypothetical protein HC771_25805 [Synechococcales cyanobacterium CRU_2_2]|nr:hypothetical protein [Synechococcales cyanobacterium CRU_2_2]